MLHITTPYGNRYIVHDNGDIQRTDMDHRPSGKWKMLGLARVQSSRIDVPLEHITKEWLAENSLCFSNGKPRYTVVDLDYGTIRIWGNTAVHGIRTIHIT